MESDRQIIEICNDLCLLGRIEKDRDRLLASQVHSVPSDAEPEAIADPPFLDTRLQRLSRIKGQPPIADSDMSEEPAFPQLWQAGR